MVECSPSIQEALDLIPIGVVTHACNPNTMEAGNPEIQAIW